MNASGSGIAISFIGNLRAGKPLTVMPPLQPSYLRIMTLKTGQLIDRFVDAGFARQPQSFDSSALTRFVEQPAAAAGGAGVRTWLLGRCPLRTVRRRR